MSEAYFVRQKKTDLQDGYGSFVQFARDKINDTLGIGFSIDDEEYIDRLSEVFDVNAGCTRSA